MRIRLPRAVRLAVVAFTAVLAMGVGLSVAQTKTPLTIVGTILPDELSVYREQIQKDMPDIDLRIIRDSTGVVVAKLLAEGENSAADIIFGVTAPSMMQIDKAGLLVPYKPKYYDQVDPKFRDRNDPPHFIGIHSYLAVVCFNTVEGKKKGLPAPASWKDLLNPVYKGHIVMPAPTSSGTGLITVSAWLQLWGEDEGWKYMDTLHENMALYTHSGDEPCTLAATGEFPVGISFDSRGAREKQRGAPLDLILPREGVGWAMAAVAISKASKNLEAAKRFADWVTGESANRVYANWWAVIQRPEFARKVEYYPENAAERIIKNDFAWEASNRDRVLKEWARRYSAKTKPEKK